MTVSSLVGIWLLFTGGLKKLSGAPAGWLILVLFVTTILCRSTGALALLAAGLSAMWFVKIVRSRILLICLLLIVPLYVLLRTTQLWDGQHIVALARLIDDDRAESFKFRVNNEDMLIDKALRRPIFGWGAWGRSRVFDDSGQDISITDGYWVIILGSNGFFGIASLVGAMTLPLGLLVHRYSSRQLSSCALAPGLALGVAFTLSSIDCLPNGQINPIYMLAAGAVTSLAAVLHVHDVGSFQLLSAVRTTSRPTMSDSAPMRRLHSGGP